MAAVSVGQYLDRLGIPSVTGSTWIFIIGPKREKTCLRGFANNTGADQPAHPRSLISAFVIRILESIISRLATGEISTFELVSVAEETDLKLALSETPKTGFVATRPICCHCGRWLVEPLLASSGFVIRPYNIISIQQTPLHRMSVCCSSKDIGWYTIRSDTLYGFRFFSSFFTPFGLTVISCFGGFVRNGASIFLRVD